MDKHRNTYSLSPLLPTDSQDIYADSIACLFDSTPICIPYRLYHDARVYQEPLSFDDAGSLGDLLERHNVFGEIFIQGISPDLKTSVKELWECLRYPDGFLHIVSLNECN